MAFLSDLITAMTSDASVNALATGGIIYENLPVDFDSAKEWITFSFTSISDEDTLNSKCVLSTYNLNVQTVSKTITKAIDMADLLKTHLINYSGGGIGDISMLDDDMDLNEEKKVYYKTINYNIIYKN